MGKGKTIFTAQYQRTKKRYYKVDRILEKKVEADGTSMYKIRWEGYGDEYATWQPLNHLSTVTSLVEAFERKEQMKSMKNIKGNITKISKPHKKNMEAANVASNQKQSQIDQPKSTSVAQKDNLEGKKSRGKKIEQNQIQSPLAEGYYQVEKIVDKKFNSSKNENYYRVRWAGFSPSADTWEPVENLLQVKHLVEAYDNPVKSKKIKKPQKLLRFFQVQKIVDKKIVNKREYFRVRWNGFTQAQDTWEPITNLKKANALIQAFNKDFDSRIRVEEIACTLKETDNYEVGGICEDSYMEEIGLIGLVDEYQESPVNMDQQFISMQMQEEQLVQANFI